MRTLILSDLHLGNGGPYDIFAGGEELPALLGTFSQSPTRVVLNGDTFDFLLNEDPLELDMHLAVRQASQLVAHPPTAEVMKALGRVLQAGGEVFILAGNHDLEIALPQVQEVLRGALQQPGPIARRLSFPVPTESLELQVGGARILVAHGEQADDFNRVDYEALLARTLVPDAPFRHPPGSMVVKSLLNPLKARERMRYMDLLKPDVEGAILTALGANPSAVKVLLSPATVRIISGLLKNRHLPPSFSVGEEPSAWEGMGPRLSEADLTEEEASALANTLEDSELLSFAPDEALDSGRVKLVRAGLKWYAKWQRQRVGQKGLSFFAHAPDTAELAEARRLARKTGVSAVVTGHTHAARWHQDDGLVYINTGTWIWLMQMPSPEASDDDWRDFLLELQDNPALEESRQRLAKLERRLTGAVVEPLASGGASLSLMEWKERQREDLFETTLEGSPKP